MIVFFLLPFDLYVATTKPPECHVNAHRRIGHRLAGHQKYSAHTKPLFAAYRRRKVKVRARKCTHIFADRRQAAAGKRRPPRAPHQSIILADGARCPSSSPVLFRATSAFAIHHHLPFTQHVWRNACNVYFSLAHIISSLPPPPPQIRCTAQCERVRNMCAMPMCRCATFGFFFGLLFPLFFALSYSPFCLCRFCDRRATVAAAAAAAAAAVAVDNVARWRLLFARSIRLIYDRVDRAGHTIAHFLSWCAWLLEVM